MADLRSTTIKGDMTVRGSLGGAIRLAVCKEDAPADSSISMALDDHDTGEDVNVLCHINGGGNLNAALPSLSSSNSMCVIKIKDVWQSFTLFNHVVSSSSSSSSTSSSSTSSSSTSSSTSSSSMSSSSCVSCVDPDDFYMSETWENGWGAGVWIDGDVNGGVSDIVSNNAEFATFDLGDAARRSINSVGPISGDRVVIATRLYHTNVGIASAPVFDDFYLEVQGNNDSTDWYFGIAFGLNGMFVVDGPDTTTDLHLITGSGSWVQEGVWQQWEFDLDLTTNTFDIYLDDCILREGETGPHDVDILSNGSVRLTQYHQIEANEDYETLVDYLYIGRNCDGKSCDSGTSNAELLDEGCTDLATNSWTDTSNDTGSFHQGSGVWQLHMDSTGSYLSNYAQVSTHIGSIDRLKDDVFSVSIRLYPDLFGTYGSVNDCLLSVQRSDMRLQVSFASDGLRVYNSTSGVTNVGNVVAVDTWAEWTFVVNAGTPALAVCQIYKDNTLIAYGVDCSYTEDSPVDGDVSIAVYGQTVLTDFDVDWIKIGGYCSGEESSTSSVSSSSVSSG